MAQANQTKKRMTPQQKIIRASPKKNQVAGFTWLESSDAPRALKSERQPGDIFGSGATAEKIVKVRGPYVLAVDARGVATAYIATKERCPDGRQVHTPIAMRIK